MRHFLKISALTLFVINSSLAIESFADGSHAHAPDGSHIDTSLDTGSTSTTVSLSDSAMKTLDLRTESVRLVSSPTILSLLGRVAADPRRVSSIGARFDGSIEKVYALVGSEVAKNEELLKLTPLQAGSNSQTIKASMNAFITELPAVPGMVFSAGDPLIELSDLSVVLFEADLFDGTGFEKIRQNSLCQVHLKRYPKNAFSCKFETVDAKLKGNPPVAHVQVSIKNPDLLLKPGMTGQLNLGIGEATEKLLVPEDAVLGHFTDRFVYIRRNNTFYRTPVRIGAAQGESVEILSGLKPGDKLVSQGHYQLQFANSDTEPAADHDHSQTTPHSHNHDHASHDQTHSHNHSHGSSGAEHSHNHTVTGGGKKVTPKEAGQQDSHSHSNSGHKHD